ncbi:DNA integrity scanning protein DisA [Actinomyces sp. Z5]|uniref:DNA integrity scanning protein DisA n=1 Tax=Actinomyces glycerinitolerans TaxID=1892869 RepID=A0A1M4RZG3_9ACTO|nr:MULTISPECIES: DNA integrity scanning diadenylate cyclase DisA [Actinomyces]RAX20185.1 DNA integrity scanning protein DisA [Actinomyces sp. Z5]SHE25319.1 dna integrity scanning disa linker region [Actinomyces glycerinitolerans]
MTENPVNLLRETLALVAPGTVLRDGLERILRGRTGAIIVLGFDETVEAISSGGFRLDVELTAARLRELAKMDGAVIVDRANNRIRRANVQLLPNASIETAEAGMRHRTAERVARQTGHPVISVSQSMRIISLYVDGRRHVIEPSEAILARANQALATLERYKARLDKISGGLDALEIEDLVTVRDVTAVLQLLEMVSRIASDIDGYVVELGTDGRLLALQVEELTRGLMAERDFLLTDYLPQGLDTATVDARLKWVGSPALLDLAMVARAMGLGGADGQDLDASVSPRGLRILSKIPRLPLVTARAVVDNWGSLQAVLAATVEELEAVDGVGARQARTLRDGLSRLAEVSIADRYA